MWNELHIMLVEKDSLQCGMKGNEKVDVLFAASFHIFCEAFRE